jgi:hypothetical protein
MAPSRLPRALPRSRALLPLLLPLPLLGGACVTGHAAAHLRPTAEVERTAPDASAAQAESAEGVRLVADAEAWRGTPADLAHVLTPLRVRVENRSGRPLALKHAMFELVTDGGFRFAALSPLGGARAADGEAAAWPASSGTLEWDGGLPPGAPGPWPRPGWGTWAQRGWGQPWGGGWGWGAGPWARPRTRTLVVEPLPSRDMVRLALPEGTLEDGGAVEGFLYFPDVLERARRVVLTASLADPSGQKVPAVSIPFDVVP